MKFAHVPEPIVKNHVLSVKRREVFDPANKEHRAAWVTFQKKGLWLINFEAEWPCVTVPQTVLLKLAEYACSKELKSFDTDQDFIENDIDPATKLQVA